MGRFLTAQRAVLKVYLINAIERTATYGWVYKEELKIENEAYQPAQSEVYKALLDLTKDGLVCRRRRKRAGSDFKEVLVYSFTEDGYHKAQVYKQQVKTDLERSRRLIDQILADNF